MFRDTLYIQIKCFTSFPYPFSKIETINIFNNFLYANKDPFIAE